MDDLVQRASDMHEDRFKRHGVVLSNWTSDPAKKHSFTLTLPRGLMVAALSNVIDNAIYWTRFRRERDERETPGAILVLSHWNDETGGMIAVVDNGPGFQLPRDHAGRPFSTTRAGGMGLGLFYCKTVTGRSDSLEPFVRASTSDRAVPVRKGQDECAACLEIPARPALRAHIVRAGQNSLRYSRVRVLISTVWII